MGLIEIDLNQFPGVESVIDLDKVNKLSEYPIFNTNIELSSRIFGCSYLIEFQSRITNLPSHVNEVYFRSAINEYVSISEMAEKEPLLNQLTRKKNQKPLFHFFDLLRVTTFHLKSVKMVQENINIFQSNSSTGSYNHQKLPIIVIDNLNLDLFEGCKNRKKYSEQDLKEILSWVNENQYFWGIFYILELSLNQFYDDIQKAIQVSE